MLSGVFLSAGCARNVAPPRRQRAENRVESFHGRRRTADHETIAALQTPHAATRSDIEVINPARREFLRAADIVDVVGIPAIDDAVVCLKSGRQFLHARFHSRRRHHQPRRARRSEALNEFLHRRRSDRAFLHQRGHVRRVAIVNHAFVFLAQQPQHHVRAHPTQTNHSNLHKIFLLASPPGRRLESRRLTDGAHSPAFADYRICTSLKFGRLDPPDSGQPMRRAFCVASLRVLDTIAAMTSSSLAATLFPATARLPPRNPCHRFPRDAGVRWWRLLRARVFQIDPPLGRRLFARNAGVRGAAGSERLRCTRRFHRRLGTQLLHRPRGRQRHHLGLR